MSGLPTFLPTYRKNPLKAPLLSGRVMFCKVPLCKDGVKIGARGPAGDIYHSLWWDSQWKACYPCTIFHRSLFSPSAAETHTHLKENGPRYIESPLWKGLAAFLWLHKEVMSPSPYDLRRFLEGRMYEWKKKWGVTTKKSSHKESSIFSVSSMSKGINVNPVYYSTNNQENRVLIVSTHCRGYR